MSLYRFGGCYELDSELRRDGKVVPLEPKPRAVLRYLAQRTHRSVTVGELLGAVWSGTRVQPTSVHQTIMVVRRAIEPIEITKTGAGYRLQARLDNVPVKGDALSWRAYACAASESGASAEACIAHADRLVAAEVERYGG